MDKQTFDIQDIINLLPPLDGYELKRYVDSLQVEIIRLRGIIETEQNHAHWLTQIIIDENETVLCMMCDKGKPARKATTSIADIPACEQCAREYQDAEDALGNEAIE